MATIIDIIMSAFMGGTLLIIILTANDIATENSSMITGNQLVQESLASVSQFVEGEFRNMGFGIPDSEKVILFADSSTLQFRVDLRPYDGIPDTVTFSLGPTSELAATQNEQDRYLYRKVNQSAKAAIGVVTQFRLRYISRNGAEFAMPVAAVNLKQIFEVETTIEVQNSHALYRRPGEVHAGERDALYSSVLWKQTRLASQNLRR